MRTYWLAIQTEIIKGRRTFALWQSFLFPLSSILLISLSIFGMVIKDSNPWLRYMDNLANTTAFFFPFFLVIIIGYYCNIEHKSNTWKHLLTQPVPKLSLFMGKLSMIFLLVLLTYAFTIILGYLSTAVLHFLRPEKFHFNDGYISFMEINKPLLKVYLSGFMIIAVQYWLSLRFRNLIVPFILGIGFIILPIAVLIILGMAGLISQAESLEKVFKYDPYSYPFAHIFNFIKQPQTDYSVLPGTSVLYFGLAVITTVLSYLDFRRRNF
jgi:hypothetical protein